MIYIDRSGLIDKNPSKLIYTLYNNAQVKNPWFLGTKNE